MGHSFHKAKEINTEAAMYSRVNTRPPSLNPKPLNRNYKAARKHEYQRKSESTPHQPKKIVKTTRFRKSDVMSLSFFSSNSCLVEGASVMVLGLYFDLQSFDFNECFHSSGKNGDR